MQVSRLKMDLPAPGQAALADAEWSRDTPFPLRPAQTEDQWAQESAAVVLSHYIWG